MNKKASDSSVRSLFCVVHAADESKGVIQGLDG